MRFLITGGGGQLASDLQHALGHRARSLSHTELDITDRDAVARAIDLVEPDVVINCAAFHNVDRCETEPDQAWRVNARAVGELALLAPKLVHLSTNYVFDGRREAPYAEHDDPRPQSVYARSKLAGEDAALAAGERTLIVRTAGLYGLHGSASKGGSFVQRMLRRGREQGVLRVVADQRLQPTFTADLAEAIVEAVQHDVQGVVHLTAEGACSWHEFTAAIMDLAGLDVPVHPTATVIPPGGADRPLNGVLARPRADALGLTPLRPWRTALQDYMARAAVLAR